MKKKIKILISVFLTVIFFLYIVIKIDWATFYITIQNLNYYFLFLASLTYLISYYLRALRLKLLIGDSTLKTRKLLGINFLHNFYNRIIPARLGDFSLIYLLRKLSNSSIHSSINIFIFVKLYDLLVSFLLLAISYTILYQINIIGIGIWIITILILILTLKPSAILNLIQRFLGKLSHWKIFRRFDKELSELISNSQKVETNYLRTTLFLTSFGIWLLIFILFFLLFLSINQNYGVWDTLFATTLANFSWVLPINGVGGLGTMEVSMGFAFAMRGYSFDELLLNSLYINVIVFLLSALFAIVPYFKLIRKGNENEVNHSNPMP